MKRGKEMKCEFCDSETSKKKVKKQHWFKGKLYIVENVEAEVCRECGERYFHATTLDRIDKIISGDHSVKEILSVEVVSA
jgi:YgiT-type zinc finger domain-containing protein